MTTAKPVRNSTNAFFLDKLYEPSQKLFKHISHNSIDLIHQKVEGFEHPQFTKYGVGQYYDWHIDYYPETRRVLGADRILSASILLNDDFVGGNFQFKYGDTDIHKIDMKVGDVILFHAKTFHCVTPVESGIRYSFVMWTLGKDNDSTDTY